MYFFQKVKELTYLHSEGILAGELKHGPLALIDKQMPIIMILTRDPVYKVQRDFHIYNLIFFIFINIFILQKCTNALQQVTAREGRPIVICEKDDVETKSLAWQTIDVPHTVDCLQVNAFELKYFGFQ